MWNRFAMTLSVCLSFASWSFSQITANFVPTTSATSSAVNTLNVPVTVNVGSNRILILMLGQEDVLNSADLGITSVTRGSQTLTRLTSANARVNGTKTNATSIWYLINPNQTSDAINVSTVGVNDQITGAAFVYNGVRQDASGLIGASNTSLTTSISTSITPIQNGSTVLDIGLYSLSAGNLTPTGTGHSEFAGLQNTANMTVDFGLLQNVTSSSQTLGWNQSTSGSNDRMAQSAVTLSPVPEPATLLAMTAFGAWGWRRLRRCK